MMTRAEKLFNIRAQVAKAASDIDHGDTYGACLALGDALSAVLEFLEQEMPEKPKPTPDVRKALDDLRAAEAVRIKVKK